MNTVRVLIVDDVAQVRQSLRTVLSLTADIEVVGEAVDGREAVQQVEALHPDVVLMDLEMPEMDGYTATLQIKARWPCCQVVALSVHSYGEARQKARQSGVDEFIEKGASLKEILQAITKGSRTHLEDVRRSQKDFSSE
jgi:DNA-binding NarL/FixJ family response regulator